LEVSDIIAVYAALVGTAAVAWPVWQARKARRPDVEVVLILTTLRNEISGEEFRCLFLEAHNRGNHPIRVTTAGVSNEKINYSFMPGRIDVRRKGAAFPHASIGDDFPRAEISTIMPPPIPGIVLPHDSGSRMLPEEAMSAILASLLTARSEGEAYQGLSAEELVEELAEEAILDFDSELVGWINLATGDPSSFSTKLKRHQH
jgi:hypothetical protein